MTVLDGKTGEMELTYPASAEEVLTHHGGYEEIRYRVHGGG